MSTERRKKLKKYLDQRPGGFALITAMAEELRYLWAREKLLDAVADAASGLGLNNRSQRLTDALDALDQHDSNTATANSRLCIAPRLLERGCPHLRAENGCALPVGTACPKPEGDPA